MKLIVLADVGKLGAATLPGSFSARWNVARPGSSNTVGTQTCALLMFFLTPVTTSDGRLVGLLRRQDAAKAALELHEREHHSDGGKA